MLTVRLARMVQLHHVALWESRGQAHKQEWNLQYLHGSKTAPG